MPGDPHPRIENRPGIGTVFNVTRFREPSAEGVAEGFQRTGYWDFPEGGFSLAVERGVQKVRIEPTATSNGDVGIERHFAVRPGDVYRLTSRLRVAGKTGKFKGRVNLSARRRDAKLSQVKEFNDSQEEITNAVVERSTEAVIPEGTDFVSVRVKFHTSEPGESGEGEIHSMRLERIAAPTPTPAGTRLSLYNFNIHLMRDDWRGWIEFIGDQGLRRPDVVLLQDVEHDADRVALQQALGEAFGGTWMGRGTNPQWQSAIVWRQRRFTHAKSLVWHGFGGGTCVDGSQDAPAIQVKLNDTLAKKSISLVSLKTPPQVDDDCVASNMEKVHRSFAGEWAGDLCVIGMDANAPARDPERNWMRWYRRTVRSQRAELPAAGTLGFYDPVTEVYGADPVLLDEHVTLPGKGRVDFLLVRTDSAAPPSIVRQMTLPRGSADGAKWSDHRSLHVEIAY